MKSFSIFILLTVFTIQLYSQDLTNETVIGTWKVVDCQIMPEMLIGADIDGKKKAEQMRIGLIGTIINFEKSKKFTIKFTHNIPKFMKELEFLNNTNWKIEKEQRIVVGTKEDGYSLMEIIIKTKEGKKYFFLDEASLILEVIQQTE